MEASEGVRHRIRRLRPPRRIARVLARSRGFTAAILASLGIGAGVAATVLALFRLTGLEPLRIADRIGIAPFPWVRMGVPWTELAAGPTRAQGAALKLLLLLAAGLAALVLAAAVVGLVVLLGARAATRRHEMAVRAALGGTPRRISLQLLAEGAAIAALGLAAAIPLLLLGGRLLEATRPPQLLRLPIDGIPLGTLALAALAALTLALALAPGLALLRRTNLRAPLMAGSRATATRAELAMRGALGGVMVAACVTLLAAGGTLLRSSAPLFNPTRLGFDPSGVSVLRLDAAARGPGLPARYEDALRRLRALPGVKVAGLASAGTPLGLGPRDMVFEECMCSIGDIGTPWRWAPVRFHAVGPGYFDTLRVKLLRGRDFTAADRAGARPVAVIDHAFAVNYFQGDPIGRNIQVGGRVDSPFYTVVGIVDDVRARGIGMGTDTLPSLYLSALQHPPEHAAVAVRLAPGATLDGVPLRAALGPVLPAGEEPVVRPMPELLEEAAAPLRWFSGMFAALGGVGGLVAAFGLYSVMAYDTRSREREIGIRAALGASPRRIVLLVVRRSARLAAVGAAFGVAGVYLSTGLLGMLSFGTRAVDPALLAAIAGVVLLIALAGSVLPALSAARVDPSVPLRAE